MNWFSANGVGSTVPAGPRGSDADAMNGNAVMYDAVAGKILTVGGGPSYQVRRAELVALNRNLGCDSTQIRPSTLGSGVQLLCFLHLQM